MVVCCPIAPGRIDHGEFIIQWFWRRTTAGINRRISVSSTNSAWSRDAVWTVGYCSSVRAWLLTALQTCSLCDCIKAASAFCCQSSAGIVPSYRLSSYERRACSVAGPTTWNSTKTFAWSCSHQLRPSVFARLLKTFLFSECTQRIRGCFSAFMRYINLRLTYLLTYLLSWCRGSEPFSFSGLRRRCRRHRVASSGRRVAPPWPRRMAYLQRLAGTASLRTWSVQCARTARTTSPVPAKWTTGCSLAM